ncbi:type I restriction-modification system, specificity subunit S [Myroides odoratimimus]|uniref:restriction endonuclease subunit S n=1 Tax=Myroides odoratimimus TaxID=76832 RepID=UPI00072AD52B|nr:restriction endonuclease subunit S [Myroides odoratimimus]GAQ13142.1 type I restriction-modification system, specificity subunit S [Myroides odoratimimus]STZ48392.1 Type I restriction enzyme EcoKI specificity protein [Myroides odoratimimus]
MKKYDSYKDSGIEWLGEIPSHWEVNRLGIWFKERREKVSDKVFEPLSVTKNGVVPQLESAAKSNDGDNRKLVKKGDFVINSRSDRKGSSGLSYLDGSVSLINIVLQPIKVNGNYVNYLLKSNSFIEEFYRNGHGIVADLWTTRYEDMKFIGLGIPPIKEQQVIATFLDDKCGQIDKAIEIKEKQIGLLKEQRQIIIHNAVTKGIDKNVKLKDSGVDWIGDIPEHWEVKRLRYLGITQNGLSKGGEFFGKGTPFVNYSDVYKNFTLPTFVNGLVDVSEDEIVQYSVKKGDIFFTRTSETVEEIGISSVALESYNKTTFAGFLIRFRPNSRVFLPMFSKYFFRSEINRFYFIGNMNIVIRASLSQELLKGLPILLPSLQEQQQIVDYLDEHITKIDKSVAIKEQQIEKLKEYKQSLINEVVTGKVRVS